MGPFRSALARSEVARAPRLRYVCPLYITTIGGGMIRSSVIRRGLAVLILCTVVARCARSWSGNRSRT